MRFVLYFLRWQASTPILAGVIWLMADWPGWISAAVANAIGAAMFYWVDRAIMRRRT